MKAINFLLLSLIISIAFSCVTPQPKSRANLVAKGRNSNLNGFGRNHRACHRLGIEVPFTGSECYPFGHKVRGGN